MTISPMKNATCTPVTVMSARNFCFSSIQESPTSLIEKRLETTQTADDEIPKRDDTREDQECTADPENLE
jgi:hypothetical protein